jgi:hypothetical protein
LGREAVIHPNLDLVDDPAVPQSGRAIGSKGRARAEVDIIPFRLSRPIVSKVKLAAEAYQPAAAMTACAEAVGWQEGGLMKQLAKSVPPSPLLGPKIQFAFTLSSAHAPPAFA